MNRLFLVFMMFCFSICGKAFDVGNYRFGTSKVVGGVNGVYISCKNTEELSGDIAIPSTVEYNGTTYTVVEIKDHGFWRCSDMTSVVVPETVVKIGQSAFGQCTSLVSASLKGAADIDEFVFYRCTSLETVILSTKLEVLPKGAFYSCTALKNVILPYSIKVLSDEAFSDCSSLESIALPQNLEKIGTYAFSDCPLKNVVFPPNLSVIDTYAYRDCSSLEFVSFPAGLKEIGCGAFSGCSSLRQINFDRSSSPSSIGDDAFANCAFTSFTLPKSVVCDATGMGLASCPNLTSINVESGNPKYYVKDGVLFCNNDTLVAYPGGGNPEYTVPSNTKAIASGAFANGIIQKVVLPDGLKYIGRVAFYTTKMASVNIPSSVETICDAAFEGSLLSDITIHDGIKELAPFVFSETNLSSFVMPNTVEKVSRYAFGYCENLSSLTIGTSVKSIEENSFYGCKNLQFVYLPAAVNDIAPSAFVKCGLQKFEVDEANQAFSSVDGVLMNKEKTVLYAYPGSLTGEYVVPSYIGKIGESAFECSNLKKVELGEGVKEVDVSAFRNSEIEAVVFPSTLMALGQYAFNGCSNLKEIYAKMEKPFEISYYSSLPNYDTAVLYVPTGTKELYMSTKYWSYFKNIVEKDYSASSVEGIDGRTAPVEVARYNVSGQRTSSVEKGLGIVKMSDGSVRKIYK